MPISPGPQISTDKYFRYVMPKVTLDINDSHLVPQSNPNSPNFLWHHGTYLCADGSVSGCRRFAPSLIPKKG